MIKFLDVALRFADDDDMLSFEEKLDLGKGNGIWPRTDKNGNPVRDWGRYHQLAMNELGRRLRGRKDTAEPLELGRLDPRSKALMRPAAACFALHYLFMAADNTGDANDYCSQRAGHYWQMGGRIVDTESVSLDYDTNNSGSVDESEKNQPFPSRFIRG